MHLFELIKNACVPETETSILSLTKCKTPLVYDVYASALHRELQGGISIFGDGRTDKRTDTSFLAVRQAVRQYGTSRAGMD